MVAVKGPGSIQIPEVARDPGVRAGPVSFGAPQAAAIGQLGDAFASISDVTSELAAQRKDLSDKIHARRFGRQDEEGFNNIQDEISKGAGEFNVNAGEEFLAATENIFDPNMAIYEADNPDFRLTKETREIFLEQHNARRFERGVKQGALGHNETMRQLLKFTGEAVDDIMKRVASGDTLPRDGMAEGQAVIDDISHTLNPETERAMRKGLNARIAQANNDAMTDPDNVRYNPERAVQNLNSITPDKRDIVNYGYQFYQQNGLENYMAAAILGHLDWESGGFNVNAVGDAGKSRGISQLDVNRRAEFEKFVARKGTTVDDPRAHIEFVMFELEKSEPEAYEALLESRNLEEAVAAFMIFLRPKNYHINQGRGGLHFKERLAAAGKILGASGDLTVGYGDKLTHDETVALKKSANAARSGSNSLFVEQVKNNTAALHDGRDVPPYDLFTLQQNLGQARGMLEFNKQDRAMLFGAAARNIPQMTAKQIADIGKGFEALRNNPANVGNYLLNDQNLKDWRTLSAAEDKKLREDPASYGVENDEQVAMALKNQERVDADPNSTLEEMRVARKDYADKQNAFQKGKGLTQDEINIVSKTKRESIEEIIRKEGDGSAEKLWDELDRLATLWGPRWPELMADIAANNPDMLLSVSGNMTDPGQKVHAINLIELAKQAQEDPGVLERNTPKEALTAIDAGITTIMADFAQTFGGVAGGGVRQIDEFRRGVKMLAMHHATADGMSGRDALEKAYTNVLEKSYHFREINGRMTRIPIGLDSVIMVNGGEIITASFNVEDLGAKVPPSAALPDPKAASDAWQRQIRGNGTVSISANEDGFVILDDQKNVVVDTLGEPIVWLWAELEEKGRKKIRTTERDEPPPQKVLAVVFGVRDGSLIPFNPVSHTPQQGVAGKRNTERTVTVKIDGKVALVPTLYFSDDGSSVDVGDFFSEEIANIAQIYEQRTGLQFPRFDSEEEAKAFAADRSQGGGATRDVLAQPAQVELETVKTKTKAIEFFNDRIAEVVDNPEEAVFLSDLITDLGEGTLTLKEAKARYADRKKKVNGDGLARAEREGGIPLPQANPRRPSPKEPVTNAEGVSLPRPRPGKSVPQKFISLAATEFDLEIIPFLDKVAELGYDQTKAKVVAGEGFDTTGFFVPPDFTDRDLAAGQADINELTKGEIIERDKVYVTADGISDASVYAHEFRHRGYSMLKAYLKNRNDTELEALTKIIKSKFNRFVSPTSNQILDALKALQNLSGGTKRGELLVAYMDRHGSFAQQFLKDNKGAERAGHLAPGGTPGRGDRRRLLPVIASHLAAIMMGNN